MKDLVIIGCGGLGREVCQYIDDINAIEPVFNLLGFIDDNPSLQGKTVCGAEVLGNSGTLRALSRKKNLCAFCAIASTYIKVSKYGLLKELNIKTVNIIHPTAYVTPSVSLGTNVLIGPMCVLTTNIQIGDCVHINPLCGIGHDVTIGDYTTLYWHVSVGGAVRIGKMCELGSHTFVKQQLTLDIGVITGAGSVVTKDVRAWDIIMGVPARSKSEV